METLARIDGSGELDRVVERVSWYGVDGLEVDLTEVGEEGYRQLREEVAGHSVPVRSIHYGRTESVSLQEWELFSSQLDFIIERAEHLGCDCVSVHPPRAEIHEAHTARDLQTFIESAEAFVQRTAFNVSFLVDGFLKEPELVNTGFQSVDAASIGITIDISRISPAADPVSIIEAIQADIHKIVVPYSIEHLEEEIGPIDRDVQVVAEQY